MIEAFITNLGKYVAGELCGEYLKLPATQEDVQALLSRIGVDGIVYEEIFITDYETDVSGLYDRLGEYESVDELNYLAALLEDLDKWELEKFEAAVSLGDDTGSVKELINLAQNLDCYDYFPGVHNDSDLGYYLIDELCMLEIPKHIQMYFDYEAYGRDFTFSESRHFADNGYVMRGYGSFTEHYSGRDDLPDEHRIFSYPDTEKMSMKDRLSMYQQMAHTSNTIDKPAPTREDR